MLKSQQRFESNKDNEFSKEANKIALIAKYGKRMQSINSIETYRYGKSRELAYVKKEIKCNNIIKKYKNDWLWWCYKRKHKRT